MVSDPQALRALAHPVRLAALTHLQQHGPATATQLAGHVGASPSVTSWHLRHLATFGLVLDVDPAEAGQVGADRRQRYWKAVARGFSVDVGTDPDSQAAGAGLLAELIATAEAHTAAWLEHTEPDLPPRWRAVAGVSNTRLHLSAEELDDLADAVNDLLAPYVGRSPAQAPPGAGDVRMIRYYLPESPSDPGKTSQPRRRPGRPTDPDPATETRE